MDQEVSPFITFVKGKKRKHRKSHGYIVGYGSNGYCYKDSKGNFHYYVTKSPLQTVLDVNRQGLESTSMVVAGFTVQKKLINFMA